MVPGDRNTQQTDSTGCLWVDNDSKLLRTYFTKIGVPGWDHLCFRFTHSGLKFSFMSQCLWKPGFSLFWKTRKRCYGYCAQPNIKPACQGPDFYQIHKTKIKPGFPPFSLPHLQSFFCFMNRNFWWSCFLVRTLPSGLCHPHVSSSPLVPRLVTVHWFIQ